MSANGAGVKPGRRHTSQNGSSAQTGAAHLPFNQPFTDYFEKFGKHLPLLKPSYISPRI